MIHLEVTCLDPIVARDGRPFGAGGKMRPVSWPLPSVVAGSFRTLLGKLKDPSFGGDLPARLRQVEVRGFLPQGREGLYFPKPEDCVGRPGAMGVEPELLATRPVSPHQGGGCDLPEGNLLPVMLDPSAVAGEFKPAELPEWWPAKAMVSWLTDCKVEVDSSFLGRPAIDERVHLEVQPETGAAEEGKIFSTASLSLAALPRHGTGKNTPPRDRYMPVRYPVRVSVPDGMESLIPLGTVHHPLGGEGRMVAWSRQAGESCWECPQKVSLALQSPGRKIRMVLATPALFSDGWKPGWLDRVGDHWEGQPPGAKSVRLRLVGASVPRWRAISGWSLAKPWGPKPTRRMVPAGAVYFLELVSGDAGELANHWLEPVSDGAPDRAEGFGLALWGIW